MSANGAPYSYSNHTLEKVAKAKATLESFYANLITQHQERKNRFAFSKTTLTVPVLISSFLVLPSRRDMFWLLGYRSHFYERRVECCSLEGLTLIACTIFSLQMESFGDEYATTRFNGRRGLYVLPQLLFQNLLTDTFFILF